MALSSTIGVGAQILMAVVLLLVVGDGGPPEQLWHTVGVEGTLVFLSSSPSFSIFFLFLNYFYIYSLIPKSQK